MGSLFSKPRFALPEESLEAFTALAEAHQRSKEEKSAQRDRRKRESSSSSDSTKDFSENRRPSRKRRGNRSQERRRPPSYDSIYDDDFCGRCGKRKDRRYVYRSPSTRYGPGTIKVEIVNPEQGPRASGQAPGAARAQAYNFRPNDGNELNEWQQRSAEGETNGQPLPQHQAEFLHRLESLMRERHRERVNQERTAFDQMEILARGGLTR